MITLENELAALFKDFVDVPVHELFAGPFYAYLIVFDSMEDFINCHNYFQYLKTLGPIYSRCHHALMIHDCPAITFLTNIKPEIVEKVPNKLLCLVNKAEFHDIDHRMPQDVVNQEMAFLILRLCRQLSFELANKLRGKLSGC